VKLRPSPCLADSSSSSCYQARALLKPRFINRLRAFGSLPSGSHTYTYTMTAKNYFIEACNDREEKVLFYFISKIRVVNRCSIEYFQDGKKREEF